MTQILTENVFHGVCLESEKVLEMLLPISTVTTEDPEEPRVLRAKAMEELGDLGGGLQFYTVKQSHRGIDNIRT